MELSVRKTGKKRAGKVKVADEVFGVDFNEPLVHQVLTSYLANGRAATKSLKNRSAVRGGGKKPWRQKGLGRARAGTRNSPIWRGGGVTFANNQRTFARKVNRKMYRGALRSILSELVRQERLICIDELNIAAAKTKAAIEMLAQLGLEEVLIITDSISEELHLSTRNLAQVAVIDTHEINPHSLIGFERVLITRAALEKVGKWLEPGMKGSGEQPQAGDRETAEQETPDGGKEDE